MKAPRRKVVSSRRTITRWSGLFACTLDCGHEVTAQGRAPEPGLPTAAPKTASCQQCAKLEGRAS